MLDDLNEGIRELNIIYWMTWCTIILFVVEFAIMAIGCFHQCLEKAAREQTNMRNLHSSGNIKVSSADVTYMAVAPGSKEYSQMQPD